MKIQKEIISNKKKLHEVSYKGINLHNERYKIRPTWIKNKFNEAYPDFYNKTLGRKGGYYKYPIGSNTILVTGEIKYEDTRIPIINLNISISACEMGATVSVLKHFGDYIMIQYLCEKSKVYATSNPNITITKICNMLCNIEKSFQNKNLKPYPMAKIKKGKRN